MDIRIATKEGYAYDYLPMRNPGETVYDYTYRLFADVAHGHGYGLTQKGKRKVKRMFPGFFDNNYRRMHGMKLIRVPEMERRKRK